MKTVGLLVVLFLICGGVARSDYGLAGGAAAEGFASGCASGMAHRHLREAAPQQQAALAAVHPCPIDHSETYFVRLVTITGATEMKAVRRCLLYSHETIWPATD